MAIRQQDLSWTESLPVVMASGRRARGKPKKGRTEDVLFGPAEQPKLSKEFWEAYKNGALITSEAAESAHRARNIPLFATKEQLGLEGLDWSDEAYRRAYRNHVIIREIVEENDSQKSPDGIFLVAPNGSGDEHHRRLISAIDFYHGEDLKEIEPYDAENGYGKYWMTAEVKRVLEKAGLSVVWDDSQGSASEVKHYKISPGNNSVSKLQEFLRRFSKRNMEVVMDFNRHYGFAIVKCKENVAVFIAKRGYEVEEHDPSMNAHLPYI